MTTGQRRLLDRIAGPAMTLDRAAKGQGRVATAAHPLCTCHGRGTYGIRTCPQHPGRTPYSGGTTLGPRFWTTSAA